MFPAAKQSPKPFHLNPNQKGQGILEIIVVLGIATILITALVVLAVRANRNAEFARAEDQASRLAQEGLEAIRAVRDYDFTINPNLITLSTNCANIEGASGPSVLTAVTWEELFSGRGGFNGNIDETGPNCDLKYGKKAYLLPPDGNFCRIAPGIPDPQNRDCFHLLLSNSSTAVESISSGGRNFERYVYVADTPVVESGLSQCNLPGEDDFRLIKQFTVKVLWQDSSGDHEQVVSSCITREGHV